jgi:hypothetical protein
VLNFIYRFPDAPKHVRKHNIESGKNAKSTDNLHRRTYCSNGKKRTLNSDRKTFYDGGSNKESLGNMHKTNYSKFSTPMASRPPFVPVGFQQARDEIAEKNNYLLQSEYYSREKELNFENFQKSKSMWKGDPLFTTRKHIPVKLPKSKIMFLKKTKNEYLNNNNGFQTFLTDDVKRLQILSNYKEINRIITKNFIKKHNPSFDIMQQEDDSPDGSGGVIFIFHNLER